MLELLILVGVGLGGLVLGGGLTYLLLSTIARRHLEAARHAAQDLVEESATKKKEMLLEAKDEAIRMRTAAESENKERRTELQRLERRLVQRDESLERKLDAMEKRERHVAERERETENLRAQALKLKKEQMERLELIADMSSQEAKQLLLQSLETEVREEANRRLKDWEAELQQTAEARGRETLVQAIQRVANQVVAEVTTSVVPLPSDEMKGRLIGREGRNIRALEQATGVELIIDDTPEAVTLSSFDPIRREVARLALNRLILDGRIHPARIEEVVERSRSELEATIISEGEEAAVKGGVRGLHPEVVKLLGRLRYRTSYGQNVLAHSIEVAQLAGLMAAEVGADADIARRAGLLHDLGKGSDQELEGTHAAIGTRLLEQWEKSPLVIQAVAEHHLERGTSSIYGYLVAAADALSSARPGARRESLEQYIQRLTALESICNSFPGVEKSFAIQAGREVRIMVKPEAIDDLGSVRLARDISRKIEETLQYPGQIKVTVIRETRAVEYAH